MENISIRTYNYIFKVAFMAFSFQNKIQILQYSVLEKKKREKNSVNILSYDHKRFPLSLPSSTLILVMAVSYFIIYASLSRKQKQTHW